MQASGKPFLLFGLQHYQIDLVADRGKYLDLAYGYQIEIEGPNLFKLIYQNQVVAPFADVEELCEFLKQDIQLNHG